MSTADAVAYVDEAGEKGFVRNLTADRDSKIGLLGALVFPLPRIDEFRAAFEPHFERFKNEGGGSLKKLHITEAFRPGNEHLRPMAVEVRSAIFDQVRVKSVPVIYTARRMRLLRKSHALLEELKAQAGSTRRSKHIAIPNRPSGDRIEGDLIKGLTLLLDTFSIDCCLAQIDVATDDMDLPIAIGLNESMDQTRSISFAQTTVKAFNLNTRKPVTGTITVSVPNSPFELDVKHVGDLVVVGKDDPLVFATDVVVNALNDHLVSLVDAAPLNAPSSVKNWTLEDRVWGTRDDAIEDII